MKKVLFVVLVLIGKMSYGQYSYKKISFIEKDGIKITKGDTIKLGLGSKPNGDFTHVILNPSILIVDTNGIRAAWSNKMFLIEKIYESHVGLNKSFSIVVRATGITRFMITDIELAIQKREVIGVNSIELH